MSQWSEYSIARAIALQTLARRCVVLVDNCNWTGHECDVLGVTTDLRIIDVEVKISRADLKADARKDKWWHRQYGEWIASERRQEVTVTPRAHPPKVWKHYYALPADIWRDDLFAALPSTASGVLLLRESRNPGDLSPVIKCIRRATPARDAHKLTPAQVMNIARLANLRMWEAYQRRDQAQQREAVNA
ncbi:MAG: hypothetical protein KKD25_01765 [Gammaproteobacteria bacterium]|nr:hypothetical protein [Gammaproteobacteria bacterium]MBU0771775.1 hypothetical protein [Gammaproteobacteria bacterium]MBU0855531.1 hypothetical protein [Gammaproteobacteria bacterium]MBU1846093.1 hypothetical protein [Gammaproteobacteria bacterium]